MRRVTALVALTCLWLASMSASTAFAQVTLTPVAAGLNNPIGIDYHQPTNQLVISLNYPTGSPNNFALIDAVGNVTAFTSVSGFTDEVNLATARSGGSFPSGELFCGNGIPGQLVRISGDGLTVLNPWVVLPGETGLLRGGLHVDTTGVFGGDLIVATTAGNVWRVDSAGNPTLLTSIGVLLEGVTTVPNDSAKYGPWAGTILAGAEGTGCIYAIDSQGKATCFQLGIDPEDLAIVPANEHFFGVDFSTGTIWGAPASQFAGMVGDVVIAQESGPLFDVHWNGASFDVKQIAQVGQWEDIAFAPTCNFDETPPSVSCSVALSMLWPPNHNLINVGLSVTVSDNCDPNPTVTVQVFGNEDDQEPTGDGNFSPDAKNIAPNTLRLRSERKGNGKGRVYLIVVKATDKSGNTGFTCCTVVVPHDKSKASIKAVNALAAAAQAFCQNNNGAPPPNYFVIGDGPTLGRKQ